MDYRHDDEGGDGGGSGDGGECRQAMSKTFLLPTCPCTSKQTPEQHWPHR